MENNKVLTPPVGSDIEVDGKLLSVVPNQSGEFGDCAGCYFFSSMKHCPEQFLCGLGRSDNKPVIFKDRKSKNGSEK